MRKYLVFCIFALLVLAVAGLASTQAVYSQEEEAANQYQVTGEITTIYPETSQLVVTYTLDEAAGLNDEVLITANDMTTIEKDTAKVDFADLKTGDKAAVAYTIDDEGNFVAISVVVTSQ